MSITVVHNPEGTPWETQLPRSARLGLAWQTLFAFWSAMLQSPEISERWLAVESKVYAKLETWPM